jgi:hypothetical protein
LPCARLRVTVPDFLQQTRLLSGKRYSQLLRQMGVQGLLSAGWAALPMAISEHGPKFWVAAIGLLASDLAHTPRDFSGTLLLHSYLTDLAQALERVDVVDKMLATCRRMRPRARVGFHTNLAPEAANLLPMLKTKVDEVSVLTSPGGLNLSETMRWLRQASKHPPALTAEVGPAPALVHRLAASSPDEWTHGADAILVSATADEGLATVLRSEKERSWSQAFPGLDMPEASL